MPQEVVACQVFALGVSQAYGAVAVWMPWRSGGRGRPVSRCSTRSEVLSGTLAVVVVLRSVLLGSVIHSVYGCCSFEFIQNILSLFQDYVLQGCEIILFHFCAEDVG